jgi:hypothetical protein
LRARVYSYELRRGDQIVATGYLNHDSPPAVGDRVTVAGHTGIIREIIPGVGHNPKRLIIQLLPNPHAP